MDAGLIAFTILYAVIAITVTLAARYSGGRYDFDRIPWWGCILMGVLWPVILPLGLMR